MPAPADRRTFLARSLSGAAALSCAGVAWSAFLVESADARPDALRPPGAGAEADFNARCVKCGLCVEACPYGTLGLATLGGKAPAGTPYFEPRSVPCYMCPGIPCVAACPTGALDRGLTDVAKARMGLAVIDAEHCLSWLGLRCEVCHRVCPVAGQAISVSPHPREISKHAVFVPVVHADACTGCGVCEKACPTEAAAIRVVPPALVQGRIGAHYRLGWRDDAPDAREVPSVPAAPAAASPGAAPGVNYLNGGARP